MFIDYIPLMILAGLTATFFYAKYHFAPRPSSQRVDTAGISGIIAVETSQSRSASANNSAANVVVRGMSSKSESIQPIIIGEAAAGSARRPNALIEEDVIVLE